MESPKVLISVLVSPELMERVKKQADKDKKKLSVFVRDLLLEIFPEETVIIEQKKEIELVKPLESKEENKDESGSELIARLKREMDERKNIKKIR